jgi:hypothetical protein
MASTNSAVIANIDTVRALTFNLIGASFVGVGIASTAPVRSILIQNNTDAVLWFSFDGINNHFPLASYSQVIFDLIENIGSGDGCYIAKNSILFVKRFGVPTVGSVYVTFVYGITV